MFGPFMSILVGEVWLQSHSNQAKESDDRYLEINYT